MKSTKVIGFFIIFILTVSIALADAGDAYPVTTGDRDFLGELRTAVLSGDAGRVALLVQFPISVPEKNGRIELKGARDFTLHYKEIFTEKVKSAIRQQVPEKLQKNWQGVMIGKGEIWFDEIEVREGEGFVRKIIGINP